MRTHDLYKYVMSSIGGDIGRVLAIGGGDGEVSGESQSANRFEPVVRFLGPFKLPAGQTKTHRVKLPNYVGAVRVMVVGNSPGAYGSEEQTVPVVQPLMLLPTLPRVLGPEERVDLPVNVFAMKDNVRDVRIDVSERSGLVTAAGQQSLSFREPGNQLTYFPVEVGQKSGIATFDVRGRAGSETASQEIEIDIRQPNTMVYRSTVTDLAANGAQEVDYAPFGANGTRKATLEISRLPSLKLEKHLSYLLRYPYGCVEQTTSPAFAQLVLAKVMNLTPDQELRAKNNVRSAISRLRNFQTSGGGMAYWPGGSQPHPWASNYVLHFLTAAEKAGFRVPQDMLSNLTKFQRTAAGNASTQQNLYASQRQRDVDQAYRLYALALGGDAEIGAMNRMRGRFDALPVPARYQLAASYALIGRKSTSQELLSRTAGQDIEKYRELGYTFGSQLRDMAVVLEAMLSGGDESGAARQALRMARIVADRRYLNTQEAAWVFLALSRYSGDGSTPWQAKVELPKTAALTLTGNTTVATVELPADVTQGSVKVTNLSNGPLFANVITAGQPRPGEEEATSRNLQLTVRYEDTEGEEIDPSRLRSGTDFKAIYTVSNPGSLGISYRQLALRTLLPSGWEVRNDRLQGGGEDRPDFDYQDFRDDRVYTFFNLGRKQTKTFTFAMTATYPGRFYLPSQVSEAMYAEDIQAAVKGQWVEVLRQ